MANYSETIPVADPEVVAPAHIPEPEAGEQNDGEGIRDIRFTPDMAQAATATTILPMSASLLREIAEAVDGTRGVNLYCTAAYAMDAKFDHQAETHATLAAAQARQAELAQLGVQVEIFGPFNPRPGAGPELGTTPIKSIVITLHDDRTITVDPTQFDALFWTVSAVDKFVLPYYASRAGLERAVLVRTMFDKAGMVCLEHGPNTEPETKDVDDAKSRAVDALREGGPKIGVTFVSM